MLRFVAPVLALALCLTACQRDARAPVPRTGWFFISYFGPHVGPLPDVLERTEIYRNGRLTRTLHNAYVLVARENGRASIVARIGSRFGRRLGDGKPVFLARCGAPRGEFTPDSVILSPNGEEGLCYKDTFDGRRILERLFLFSLTDRSKAPQLLVSDVRSAYWLDDAHIAVLRGETGRCASPSPHRIVATRIVVFDRRGKEVASGPCGTTEELIMGPGGIVAENRAAGVRYPHEEYRIRQAGPWRVGRIETSDAEGNLYLRDNDGFKLKDLDGRVVVSGMMRAAWAR